MKYLIDTHILIWLAISPEKISKSMFETIENTDNEIYVSTLSFWEIAIKLVINKLDLQGIGIKELVRICKMQNINIIEFPISAAIQYQNLPLKENHRDPFDRGLISLCISEGYTLLSNDGKIFQYKTDGLQYNN
ncbi:MAG: type II toxin-antitoxin system VapC family toxin [Bacteroidales bacterium]|nr:type II toxin-antitoxin system VapC family toxin [Bacteroidales bacterium]